MARHSTARASVAALRWRSFAAALAVSVATSALPTALHAETDVPGGFVVPRPRPATTEAATGGGLAGPPSAVPYAPAAESGTGTPRGQEVALYLVAKLVDGGQPISAGMNWRIFRETPDETGKLPLVATAVGGDGEFRLPSGSYLVHAAFGKAGTISRVVLQQGVVSETVLLNAGGLKLDAVVDEDEPLPVDEVAFDVYSTSTGADRGPIVQNIREGAIIRLPSGTYQVVSRYGAVNAVLKAEIEVQPGKLTEATLHHRAAKVTLKLVSEAGGEALANTQWSVLSPGGDTVVEDVGAFPSFVLAEGDYSVIAKNGDKIFSGTFHVEPGRNRDVELVAGTAPLTSPAPADTGPEAPKPAP